ncbi:MAG TPA: hypothetical protein DEF41_14905 [Desulfovibrio sp.]|nr:hypothetical protein [Desulfovibrio sp.]
MQKTIKLIVNGDHLTFNVDTPTYNRYLNEMQPTSKVAPAHNFLMRCVDAESRATLEGLLELPGAGVQMAAQVVGEFMPDIDIEVGK